MGKQLSNAAAERAAAQRALRNGEMKERETYTAKQVAMRCGTDAKTMRKFFRSNHSTVEAVGQGGRYEFDARDLPKIKSEFATWLTRSSVKRPKVAPEILTEPAEVEAIKKLKEDGLLYDPDDISEGPEGPEVSEELQVDFGVIPELDDLEPTEEDLEEIADLNLEEEGDE